MVSKDPAETTNRRKGSEGAIASRYLTFVKSKYSRSPTMNMTVSRFGANMVGLNLGRWKISRGEKCDFGRCRSVSWKK